MKMIDLDNYEIPKLQADHSTLSRNHMNIKKHEKWYQSIKVGTLGGLIH